MAVPHDLSVESRILLHMQTELRKVEFAPVANEPIGRINPDAIILSNVDDKEPKEGEGEGAQEITPGIILSRPKLIRSPAEAGENDEDEVFYSIPVQGIDVFRGDQFIHTYSKWAQIVARMFKRTQLDLAVFDEDGYVYFGHSERVDTIDETRFNRHHLARWFVIVTFISNEP